MAHYTNISIINLVSLFQGTEIMLFYHYKGSDLASGVVKFHLVSKKGKNFIERCYQPFKLSGRSSCRFVSIGSFINEVDRYYKFIAFNPIDDLPFNLD